MIERNIAAAIHGRYLVEAPARSPSPLLVGFHGYAEGADQQLQRLQAIPGSEQWIRVAVQGLHRFYRGRSRGVVASWMTSQDRELAIADNVDYVGRVVRAVADEWGASPAVVFSGFSQGVAMAFRAAAGSAIPVRGVIVCGADVPPEMDANALSRVPAALLGRGTSDEWYTEERFAADERRLRDAGVAVQVLRFEAGHEWTAAFSRAAGQFLAALK